VTAVAPWAGPAQRFPSGLIDRISLADGREVVVRPVLAFDAPAEQEFVRGLSNDARLARFHFGLRELPSAMARAMTEVDQEAHVAIVAEAFDDDDIPHLVADARYVRGTDAGLPPHEAEFAIAVADAWQGAGLGSALLRRLDRHATRNGVRVLVGDVLPGNRAMLGLAGALGARRVASPMGPGVVRVRIDLAGARSAFSPTRPAPGAGDARNAPPTARHA
jgi:RimJ/RimL family protein N-acetyltransferase